MLDDLRPKTLSEVAKQLGVDPFEVVRLLVVTRTVPERWAFSSDQIDRLRAAGKQ